MAIMQEAGQREALRQHRGDMNRMLRNGIVSHAMAAKAALLGKRGGEVARVDGLGQGIKQIESHARGRLNPGRIAGEGLALGHHAAFAADLYRTRAMVRLHARSERNAAAADLRHALDVARQQKAPSLELRAARDLARLLAEQGERQQAVDLLAPVLGGFTEGFSTSDLSESQRLLDEL